MLFLPLLLPASALSDMVVVVSVVSGTVDSVELTVVDVATVVVVALRAALSISAPTNAVFVDQHVKNRCRVCTSRKGPHVPDTHVDATRVAWTGDCDSVHASPKKTWGATTRKIRCHKTEAIKGVIGRQAF